MGVVYRGQHLQMGRPVAIKFPHQFLIANPDYLKRFDREARALSRLSHPNIVSVIDHGVSEGAPYLVMEFEAGRSLGDLLADGPIGAARAVPIARQVLSGLRHAHDSGVVHRDLKPDNIVLLAAVEHDFIKILDFGLAKIVRESSSAEVRPGGRGAACSAVTETGLAMGTPGYMAPEQFGGDTIDARADLYAVGVLLYLMIVGHRPYQADSPIVLMKLQSDGPPTPPGQAGPPGCCSPDLERIIMRALEADPARRWQSAGEMGAALAQAEAAAVRDEVTPRPVTSDAWFQTSGPGRPSSWSGEVESPPREQVHSLAPEPPVPSATPTASLRPPADEDEDELETPRRRRRPLLKLLLLLVVIGAPVAYWARENPRAAVALWQWTASEIGRAVQRHMPVAASEQRRLQQEHQAAMRRAAQVAAQLEAARLLAARKMAAAEAARKAAEAEASRKVAAAEAGRQAAEAARMRAEAEADAARRLADEEARHVSELDAARRAAEADAARLAQLRAAAADGGPAAPPPGAGGRVAAGSDGGPGAGDPPPPPYLPSVAADAGGR
jgi:serine/threonine protein kinase